MTLEQSQYLWSQDLLEWLEEIKIVTDDEKKVQALTCVVAELPPSSLMTCSDNSCH
ncbi:hypothetical protein [Scytonema sp. NUACC26]|uniref:hypothetical protein n=1 Tax=Scytonema sp. NUACC26 TaxID=3140176 RepID=UPI0034DC6C8F